MMDLLARVPHFAVAVGQLFVAQSEDAQHLRDGACPVAATGVEYLRERQRQRDNALVLNGTEQFSVIVGIDCAAVVGDRHPQRLTDREWGQLLADTLPNDLLQVRQRLGTATGGSRR
jgi:hypothetical protein